MKSVLLTTFTILFICGISKAQDYFHIALSGDTAEIHVQNADSFDIQWQTKRQLKDYWTGITDPEAKQNPYITQISTNQIDTIYYRAKLIPWGDSCPVFTELVALRVLPNASTIQPGNFFRAGMVIYNNNDTIIEAYRTEERAIWGCEDTLINGADDFSVGKGWQNTQDILRDCPSNKNAAYICDTLFMNGCDNWFLPSHGELELFEGIPNNKILTHKGGNPISFWTSNQFNSKNAYLWEAGKSGLGTSDKSNMASVMALCYNINASNSKMQLSTQREAQSLHKNIRVNSVDSSLTNVEIEYFGQDTLNATSYQWDFEYGNIISGSGKGPYEVTYNHGGLSKASVIVYHDDCPSPEYYSDLYRMDLFENTNPGFPKIVQGDVEWGDFNMDGWLDVLLSGSDTSQLYLNNKGKSFTPIGNNLPALRYATCQWIDLDNDGYEDFVLSGLQKKDSTTLFYAFNNTNGQFISEVNLSLPGIRNGFVKSIDFNNDGRQDLLISGTDQRDSAITKLFKNHGAMEFQEIKTSIPNLTFSEVDFGDFNQDNFSDLVIIGSRDSIRHSYLYKNKNGQFIKDSLYVIPLNNGGVDWSDFNNDGLLDFTVSGMKQEVEAYITNNGLGHYDSRQSTILYVYENLGMDSFQLAIDYEGWKGHMHSEVQWGDYDNDGFEDLFCYGQPGFVASIGGTGGNASATILLNNLPRLFRNEQGTGELFSNQANIPSNVTYKEGRIDPTSINMLFWFKAYALDLGDFNNDGNLDILREGSGRYYEQKIDTVRPAFSTIYKNQPLNNNKPPTPPQNLSSTSNCDSITLNWDADTDDHTPSITLSYDIYIGSKPGGSDIVSQANIYELRTKEFKLNRSLPSGTYYWSVRARDNAKIWGDWAPEQTFTIDIPETPEIWAKDDTLYSSVAEGNQWHNEKGAIAGATDATYIITQSGNYYNIVSRNGCSSDTSNVLEVYRSNVYTPAWADKVNISPNPFSEQIIIEIRPEQENIELTVISARGKVIINQLMHQKVILNTQSLAQGTYFIILEKNGNRWAKSIIKE